MKKVFESTKLGKLDIKNRLVRSATMEFGCTKDGSITNKYYRLYEDLAKGGVGLIITGAMAVSMNSQVKSDMIKAYNNDFSSKFKEVTDMVHKYNVKIIAQIAHGGLITQVLDEGKVALGPSDLFKGKEMTKKDINDIVNDFAESALTCKNAGADGIEIHCAHGFLVSQFLSPIMNKRTDEYGGEIKNRARILFQIIDAIREEAGEDFPVFIKLNRSDLIEGGFTFEDAKWLCKKLDEYNIDGIELSCGFIGQKELNPIQKVPNREAEGFNGEAAVEISDLVKTPIISVGGYRTLSVMEDYLNKGTIKAISLSRPLICELDLPLKLKQDNNYKCKCVSCNACFASPVLGCVRN